MALVSFDNARQCASSASVVLRGALLAGLLLALGARGAAAAPSAVEATSARDARDEARKQIPWSRLSRNDQRVTQYVVRKPSLYRRSPTHAFDCDPQVFNFLAQHPEVVVNVWNLMGVSQLSLTKTAPETYQAKDQAGARGALRVIYSELRPDSSNKIVVVAEGSYQASAMPEPISARCVLLLRSGSRKETNGRTYVTARLDSFIRFQNVGADIVARTLRPLLVKSADHNFTETMKFVSTFSRTAEQRPAGLLNLAAKLEKVEPAIREELMQLCRNTSDGKTAGNGQPTGVRLVKLQEPVAQPSGWSPQR